MGFTDSLMGWAKSFEEIGSSDFFDPDFSPYQFVSARSRTLSLLSDESLSCMTFLDDPISCDEVVAALKRLRKTPEGFDGVCAVPLRLFNGNLVSMLHTLFLAVSRHAVLPVNWSIGLILPLFKKGDPLLFDNYRGITLQSLGHCD